MQKIGLGTYKHTGKNGADFIAKAIEVGYRLIDTADHYKNHNAVKRGIRISGINREKIEICTKVWREDLSYKSIVKSVDRFLNELKVDYIDTVLIHWPNSNYNMQEAFGALVQLKNKGVIKNSGVSNFTIRHLKQPVNVGLSIDYNQVEYHVSLNQKKLYEYCKNNEIKLMAHSGLGGGFDLDISKVIKLAKKYNVSSANILYAFLIKNGIIPICGADNIDQLIENYKSLNVNLSDKDFNALNRLKIEKNRILIKDYSEF